MGRGLTSLRREPLGYSRAFAVLALFTLLSSPALLADPIPQVAPDERETRTDRDARKVTPRSGATGPPIADEATADSPEVISFLSGRFEEAKRLYEQSNFRQSWQVCESILVLAPEVPFREELRTLRRHAQGRFIARSVVLVTFEANDSQSEFPLQKLEGDVVIENHSTEAIVLGRDEKDPVLGILHFRERSLSPYSLGESAQEGTRVVRMPKEIRIESGDVHRIPLSIEFPSNGETPLMQRWMVSGVLRPITVKVGRDELTRGVPWVPNLGVSLAPEHREIAAAPLENLRRAILTGDPAQFLIASTLWLAEVDEDGKDATEGIRATMIEELLTALSSHDGALDRVAIHTLEELTGEVRERTTRSWQIWALTRPRPSTLPDKR